MPAPRNVGALDAPYFTPVQSPPVGTAVSDNPPTLFTPLKLRSQTFQNRIWVAPMCTYSAQNGYLTDFHFMHLAAFAYRGASLTIIEATAVRPEGRISPQDSGLWEDGQIEPLKRIADFIHSQGQKVGIQLAHAGRKASVVASWLVSRGQSILATSDVGGWPENVKAASPIRWGEGYAEPKEMTIDDIRNIVDGFRESAIRAVKAGIDTIEIHAAHGYLLHSVLSPLSNKRTDDYGGSFENRTRMLFEILKAVRGVIPESVVLLVRISATDWMEWKDGEDSWTVEQSIQLAKKLPDYGVDLLDVSSAGNHPEQRIGVGQDFQVSIAGRIRSALYKEGIKNLAIGCVGFITEAEVAKAAVDAKNSSEVQSGNGDDGTINVQDEQGKIAKADIVLVARQFLREPEWVLRVAFRLGVDVKWPVQYHRGTFVKGSRI